ncbi:MAG: helix-turn-helix transcriptional regulator [Spirochaetes bacterium]|nr:helix-turn-helix transcriptional regulator [Spirochaetota bacterium]
MKTDFSKEFGKKVKRYRKELNLTVEELAERMEVSVSHIFEVESGRRFLSVNTLPRLSKALNIPLTALFEIETSGKDTDTILDKEIIGLIKSCSKKQKRYMIELLRNAMKLISSDKGTK